MLIHSKGPTHMTVQKLAELIGHLVAACPAVPFGLLYTRELQILKIKALVRHQGDFRSQVNILSASDWETDFSSDR